ncbi:hypothetical protein [Candidatus Midichloria mitochondrii]
MANIFSSIHSATAIILSSLIIGHVLLTFKHMLIDKVNLLKRMI